MAPNDIIQLLQAEFGERIQDAKTDVLDPHVVVAPEDLPDVARHLRDTPSLRFELLNDITGVDYLEPDPKKVAKAGFEPHLEVLYHFQSFTHQHRFTVKVLLPRWRDDKVGELPAIPTLTGLWESADWHEREVYDLLGVAFTGHPNPARILLSDDWHGHPLRKDYEFPLEYHGIRGR